MDSLITELRNLVAIYNNKPNFIFLKALCLITWAILLKIKLFLLSPRLIFVNHFSLSYIS